MVEAIRGASMQEIMMDKNVCFRANCKYCGSGAFYINYEPTSGQVWILECQKCGSCIGLHVVRSWETKREKLSLAETQAEAIKLKVQGIRFKE